MDWDELAGIKKIVEDEDRLKRLVAEYGGGTVAEAMRYSTMAGVGNAHSAIYTARQCIEADERLRQLAGGMSVGDMAASLQIAEKARFRQDIGNLLGVGVAASLAAAEKERFRHLLGDTVGDSHLASASTTLSSTLAQNEQLRATLEGRFLLPGFAETEKMLDVMRDNFFGSLRDRYGNQLPGAQEAMLAMQAPWLDSLRTVQSIRGFAELQAIGGSLSIASSFGDEFSDSLRIDLGDWRDPITTWPQAVFESVDARRGFYVERGLNTDLTDFPDAAFDEGLSIAGVKGDTPILVVAYGELTSLFIDSEDDKALARTNSAHDHVQRFEFQLRKFINQSLTKAVGPDWPKHRLPNGIYDKWIGKKSADKGRKNELPLIAYADFTEYVDVICREDNWKGVFAATFERKESVRESFQRMHPIRIAIAHARPISNDDELFLYVEVRRLLNVMKPIR